MCTRPRLSDHYSRKCAALQKKVSKRDEELVVAKALLRTETERLQVQVMRYKNKYVNVDYSIEYSHRNANGYDH